jgi:hypothetical protein
MKLGEMAAASAQLKFAPYFFVAKKRYRHYLPLGQSQRSSRNIVLYAPQ